MIFQRREFLIFSSLVGFSSFIEAKEQRIFKKNFEKVKPIIAAVQEHMFPSNSNLPSATKMYAIEFLYETITHESYDKDIRIFVLEGAEELNNRIKSKFLKMTHSNREKALRDYEETEYGSTWLSRIMTLTIEGIFSDPVYGSNIQEEGWKALNVNGGQPRPKARYLENV